MIVYGIDGKTSIGKIAKDICCPASPCAIDDQGFVCNFIQAALPEGPLWDQAKLDYNNPDGSFCSTIANHAAFVARFTLYHVRNALWPSIREANPFTSWTTRDYWLQHWGWSNCFLDPNRSEALGALTPYELSTTKSCPDIGEEQGSVSVAITQYNRILSVPDIPQLLQDAVTKATIKALARRSFGPVPNLDNLNFIIEPLGATLAVQTPFDVWSAIERRANTFSQVVNTGCNPDEQGAIDVAVTLVNGCYSFTNAYITYSLSPAGLCVEDFEEQGTGSGFNPITGPFSNYCRGANVTCGKPGLIVNSDYEQGSEANDCCIYDIPLTILISPSGDFIAKDLEVPCPNQVASDNNCVSGDCSYIPAFLEPCDPSRPERIYPGVLAAECIVRSILPDTMPYVLLRCKEQIYAPNCKLTTTDQTFLTADDGVTPLTADDGTTLLFGS